MNSVPVLLAAKLNAEAPEAILILKPGIGEGNLRIFAQAEF